MVKTKHIQIQMTDQNLIDGTNMEELTGIIQEDGTILAEDGSIHPLPRRGTDKEGYPKVLIDASEVGGYGFMHSQSIKPFIGMKVSFIRNGGPKYHGFNHIILK
jgi:hypothetical protein